MHRTEQDSRNNKQKNSSEQKTGGYSGLKQSATDLNSAADGGSSQKVVDSEHLDQLK